MQNQKVIALDPDSTTYKHDLPLFIQYDELRATPLSKYATFNNISDVKWCFPECFDTIGEFKAEAKLHIKPDFTPYIDAPRRTSVHILPNIKTQLSMMDSDCIITKVYHHTDWCSSGTYVSKKDGTIRICFDPHKLNLSLKRSPHKIPTVEEINPELNKAKFLSKLDVKAEYWKVCLAKDSTKLTNSRTPFGRYCYFRLPFGLFLLKTYSNNAWIVSSKNAKVFIVSEMISLCMVPLRKNMTNIYTTS